MIISHHTKADEAQKIAKKICLAIENGNYGVQKLITASFGVTEFKENESQKDLITRVDSALYKAKKEGKNRVITIL